MTLSRFICTDKSVKKILNFCKDIEGLEAEHGSLSVVGVHDPKKTKKASIRIKRKCDLQSPDTPSCPKGQKYCPIHGHCSHTAENCVLLKTAITNGKKAYLAKQNRHTKSEDKQTYTKNEINVMINNACSEAVTRALKVHTSVINTNNCLLYTSPSPRD